MGYSRVPYTGYSRVLRGAAGFSRVRTIMLRVKPGASPSRSVFMIQPGTRADASCHGTPSNHRGYSEYSQGGSEYPQGVLRVLTRGTQRSGFMIPPGADTSCMRGRYSRGTKAVLERYSRGTLMDTIAACGRSVRLFVGLPVAVLSACCSFVCLPVVVLSACCSFVCLPVVGLFRAFVRLFACCCFVCVLLL